MMAKRKPSEEQKKIDRARLLRWRQFCFWYLNGNKYDKDPEQRFFMGNGRRSYMMISPKATTKTAEAMASVLLNNPKIKALQRQMLIESGWNNEVVDARNLEIIISGKDSDSNKASEIYNKVNDRIDGDNQPSGVVVNLQIIQDTTKALIEGSKK